jgi:adenylate cyclase
MVGTAPPSQGTEHPHEIAGAQPLVDRSFSFVDLCGFTHFTAEQGEQAAIETLGAFRALVRDIAIRRGVLINKWLGDGVLLVGLDVGPAIAATAELLARHEHQPLAIRAGIAHGHVLIIDGDDYVGRPVNLAARLCQAAQPGELLAINLPADALPVWTQVLGTRDMTIRSVGDLLQVQLLGLAPDVLLPPLTHQPNNTA